jgi:hypothetical protein
MLRRSVACRAAGGGGGGSNVLLNPALLPLAPQLVARYRRDGYLVLDPPFQPAVFAVVRGAVKGAIAARGDRVVPTAAAGEPKYSLKVELKEPTTRDRLGSLDNIMNESKGLTAPKTKKAGQRQDRQMDDAYAGMRERVLAEEDAKDEARRRVAEAAGPAPARQGVTSPADFAEASTPPDPPELPEGADLSNAMRQNVTITMKSDKKLRTMVRLLERRRARLDAARGFTTGHVFGGASEKRQLVDEATAAEAQRDRKAKTDDAAAAYYASDQFRQAAVDKTNAREVMSWFDNVGKGYSHLWHGDAALSGVLLESGVGEVFGRLGAELGGFMSARLFSDAALVKTPWSNAIAMHCEAAQLDFVDPRALVALTVTGDAAMTPMTGGITVLPGSHHVMYDVTQQGHELSLLNAMPPSWDFGEWPRTLPGLREIEGTTLALRPGSVLVMNAFLVWGGLPNLSSRPRELYSVYMMPDGSVFSGMKQSWMSQNAKGPLHLYEGGDTLRDDALFPTLYSAIDAE